MNFQPNQNHMTPAALLALLSGDNANFLAASTPGGIEAQEKRGQIEQSSRETLPIDGTIRSRYGEPRREMWEKLGFVFGNEVEEIFVEAKFPAGWKKKPTDHSMWSDIVDDKGRCRGALFYKAAFYDRNGHVNLVTRFNVGQSYDDPKEAYVEDACGDVQHRIPIKSQWGDEERDAIRQWLSKNYPDWQSPLAYWE